MDKTKEIQAQDTLKPSLSDGQSLLARACISQGWHWVSISRKRHLTEADVTSLPLGDDSETVARGLAERLNRQEQGKLYRYGVFPALAKWFYSRVLFASLAGLSSNSLAMVTPLFLKLLIKEISKQQSDDPRPSIWRAVVLALVIPFTVRRRPERSS